MINNGGQNEKLNHTSKRYESCTSVRPLAGCFYW